MECQSTHVADFKSAYVPLIIGPRALALRPTYKKSWDGNLLIWPDLTFNLLIIALRCYACETNLWEIMGWESSQL